jgi:hypothetical protein
MGVTGSSHIKVLGDCYDIKEGKTYSGFDNIGIGLLACVSLIVFCALMAANIVTKFENGLLIGLMMFFGVYALYGFTLQPTVSKWMFAKTNGTRVPCPDPKPECDAEFQRYQRDKNKESYLPYSCNDDRFKYT